MNIKSLLLCVTIFAAASSHGAISFDGEIPSLSEKIDLVLFNGQVRTPEGWHSAVAVGDGWIVAVGDDETVLEFVEEGTTKIDLAGRTVMPGIHDMHVHPMIAGVEEISCKLATGATPEQIQATVAV